MFKFFKKKEIRIKINDTEIDFFYSIANDLPNKYDYIKNQINKDFLLFFEPNVLKFKNWYTFSLNTNLEHKYLISNRKDYFQIKDIKLFNEEQNCFQNFNFSISEGLLIGFYIEDINFNVYDISKTNYSEISEKQFKNEDLEKLLNYFSTSEKVFVDQHFKNTYEINLKEGMFYHYKDLEDGNQLAIDNKGDCYTLNHDPYEIEKLYDYNTFKELLGKDRL